MLFEEEVLSGWGNIPEAKCKVVYPVNAKQIQHQNLIPSAIPRGLGRSYADQATNRDGYVLNMERMNHFLSFDQENGVLVCQAGTSLEDIIEHLGPRGWFPLITPGTKFVTIGGAIANDIHGKAHHVDGSFIACVNWFTIVLADGRMVIASREENSDLFFANFGGLGLLGTILTVSINLRKISTTYFKQKAVVAKNLEEMLAAIDSADKAFTSSVAWIDSLAKGKRIGRGVLTMGNLATLDELPDSLKSYPLRIGKRPKLNIPVFLPGFVLNTITVKILNSIIHWKQKSGNGFFHYDSFFYPLDAIMNWNRGYGKRGFIQYQFVIPIADGHRNITAILKAIANSGCIPFLNVLKKFGKGQGLLSFPKEGYTFAIDFPITKNLGAFTKKLDQMVLEAGGRIYLGKDAFLDEQSFKAMYPEYKEWLAIKKKYDPTNKYASDLSRRIGLTQ